MFELFIVGTIWFWIIFAAMFIFSLFLYEDSRFYGGRSYNIEGILFFGFLILFIFGKGTDWSIWSYVYNNPIGTIGWFGLYIFIGLLWSIFKWIKFLFFLKSEYGKKSIPKVSQHSEKIICWISYWPLSVIRFLIGDFLYDIVETIQKLFSNLYQSIANKIYGTDRQHESDSTSSQV